MDIGQIAAAVVATLAPFAPFLADTGKSAGKKLAETIAAKGGEAAWKKAHDLWTRITGRAGVDEDVKDAARMLARNPADETRQTMLARALGACLKEDPALAEQLLTLLGGQEAVQQVLADRSSWVEDVTQQLKGAGQQTTKASKDSVIKGVRQIKE